MRSNFFRNVEYQIQDLNEEQLYDLTGYVLHQLFESTDYNSDFFISIFTMCMGICFNDSDNFSAKEEKMVNYIDKILNRDKKVLKVIKEIMKNKDVEKNIELLNMILKQPTTASKYGMDLLKLILCFTNATDKDNDEILNRLDPMFGLVLTAEFFKGGLGSDPNRIKLNEDEYKIAKFMKDHDELYTFEQLKTKLKTLSDASLKKALDSLIEKGIVYFSDQTILGDTYGLANCEIEFSKRKETDEEKKKKEKEKKKQELKKQKEKEKKEEEKRIKEEEKRIKEEEKRKAQEEKEKILNSDPKEIVTLYKEEYKNIVKNWNKTFNEHNEEASKKRYTSEEELLIDVKDIVGKQQFSFEERENLICKFKHDLFPETDDVTAIKTIIDLINKIYDELEDLDLELEFTSDEIENMNSGKLKFSKKCDNVKKYWNDKYNKHPKVIEAIKKEKIDAIDKKIKDLNEDYNKECKNINKKIEQSKKELSSLGFFDISKKSILKFDIANLETKLIETKENFMSKKEKLEIEKETSKYTKEEIEALRLKMCEHYNDLINRGYIESVISYGKITDPKTDPAIILEEAKKLKMIK